MIANVPVGTQHFTRLFFKLNCESVISRYFPVVRNVMVTTYERQGTTRNADTVQRKDAPPYPWALACEGGREVTHLDREL